MVTLNKKAFVVKVVLLALLVYSGVALLTTSIRLGSIKTPVLEIPDKEDRVSKINEVESIDELRFLYFKCDDLISAMQAYVMKAQDVCRDVKRINAHLSYLLFSTVLLLVLNEVRARR